MSVSEVTIADTSTPIRLDLGNNIWIVALAINGWLHMFKIKITGVNTYEVMSENSISKSWTNIYPARYSTICLNQATFVINCFYPNGNTNNMGWYNRQAKVRITTVTTTQNTATTDTGCKSCAGGTYRTNTRTCIDSEIGSNNPDTKNNCQSHPCPQHTYTTNAGTSTSCKPCGSGKYQPIAVSYKKTTYWTNRLSSSCVECPAGKYWTSQGRGCEPCPGGTFQPYKGSTVCYSCAMGPYSTLSRPWPYNLVTIPAPPQGSSECHVATISNTYTYELPLHERKTLAEAFSMTLGPKMNDIPLRYGCACPYAYKFSGLWRHKYFETFTANANVGGGYGALWKWFTYTHTAMRFHFARGDPGDYICQEFFGKHGGQISRHERDCKNSYLQNYMIGDVSAKQKQAATFQRNLVQARAATKAASDMATKAANAALEMLKGILKIWRF